MSNSDNDINISSPETTRPSIKRKQNEVNFNALRQHAKKLRIGVTSNSSPSGQSKYFNKSTVSTVNHTAFNAEDYVLSYSLIDDILSFCDAKKVGNATLHVTRLKKPVRINSDIDSFGLNDVDWENDFIASPVNKPVTLDRSVVSFNQIRDNTGEYQETFSFSFALVNVLHTVFGLKTYRPRQIEIINATLANEDCFVLIPTGGGKSLCYQLPAVVSIGVTVVISPLRALISDQVNKLNALKIRAAHLCMGVKKSEMNHIIQKLYMREPPLKLLYLTPEKIKSSERVIKAFKSLYARGRLARFVIDEVHCLSNWGHDFRRDYVQLSCLRRNYPNVPLICLTATATNLVQADVIKILGLSSVKTFTHSFNRPNIKYTILPKENKSIVTDIAKLIKARFNKQTGIVYCLCRADCDKLAKEFNRLAIRAKSYHAVKLTMGVLQTKSPIPKILSIKNATLPISNPPASVSVKMHNLKVRCHEELLQECQQLAQRRTVTLCSVMNLSAIKTMSELLPTTRREMMTIQHVTLGNYEKFGETLLAITKRFRAEVDALAVSTIVREEDFTDEINWSDDEHNQVVTPFRKS